MKHYFGPVFTQKLQNLVVKELQVSLDAYVEHQDDVAANSMLGAWKTALIESKYSTLTLCKVAFVADCSLDADTQPCVMREDVDTVYVSMGNATWDHFAPHSDLWFARFKEHVCPAFKEMCSKHSLRASCYQDTSRLSTGNITLRFELVFE